MQQYISRLRDEIVDAAGNPKFIHHEWYVKYHLEIVEKISNELCNKHPRADRDLVSALVWIHDYGKILSASNQYELTISEGEKLLRIIGFPDDFIARILEYAAMLDRSRELDLSRAPIEVQIVSSADGCSHLVGPFFPLWWKENSNKYFEELMADNRKKLLKDWQHKIVLPEAREAFEGRYRVVMEQAGHMPSSFLL